MAKLRIDQFVKREDHVVWKVIDGKGVLLNLEDGAYFEVNPVGLAIWQKCDGQATLNEIVQWISDEFQETPPRVSADIMEFIADLKRRKLAQVLEQPQPTLNQQTRQFAASYRGV